ncbi:MAG: hypothetical protein HYR62_06825 [Actinobacteria bacterium]|nr:hypothetical protein [Actinomycetota bacterium]MBI3688297.1 hypothetical protein [Actinomycetota bacterium]
MSTTAETIVLLREAIAALERATAGPAPAGELRRVVDAIPGIVDQVRALLAVAERLDAPPGSCSLGWGVCPEHGATLVTAAGRSRCTVCGTTWDHDREDRHCREPAAFLLGAAPVCRGHAVAAPTRARLTPLDTVT